MLTTTPRKVIVAVFASVLLIGIAFGKFGTSPSLAEQAEQSVAAMFAPSITATKTDALTPTANNADGKADPGDTIGYTVTIANGGPDPATGLSFTDTIDPNTTLSGAAAASSVAVNDTFPVTVTGNVSIDSANLAGGPFSVTTNDYLGQNPASTISAFDATTANGGQVVMQTSGPTMGQFTYNPPAGFEGTDTFTYTLSDNAAAASAASNRTATVSITVSGMIWFINNNAAACTTANSDCGRLSNPYSSLAAFQAENGDADVLASDFFYPAANDNIFIYESTTSYTGGVTLLQGQKLIGQDATASLQTITGLTPPAGSALLPSMSPGAVAPTITNTAANGNGVTVSTNNNVLRGFTVGDTGGYDVANTTTATVGNLTILEVPLTGTGGLFRADSGGTLNVTFPTMTSTNATANGILLDSVGGTFASPNGITITNPTGTGIGIFDSTAAFTFSGTTSVTGSGNINSDTNGTGVHLTNNTGALQFATLNISPDSLERALYALTNTNTLTVTSGAISSTNGTGVEIRGTSAGSRTPINVTFTSVSTTGGAQAVNGIFLKWTSDAGAGFTVAGNGGTCTFATPTCTGGRITNTGGADNTTNGIGVYLEDVADVNLTRVRLDGHANGAIRGRTVTNFQFLNSLVDGNNGTCNAFCDVDPTDNQDGEDAVRFTNLLGSGLIDSSSISGGWSNNVRVVNTTGTLNRLTLNNNFIGDPDAVGSGQRGLANLGEGNDGVQLHARDGITAMNVTVTNNTINYGIGDVLNILNNDNTAPVGTVDAIVRNNTLVNALSFDNAPCPLCQAVGASNLTLAGLGHMTYDISCNKFGNSKGIQLNVFKGHNSAGTPSGNFTGTIYNNTLGLAGIARSGGADGSSALNVDQQGTGTGTVLIKNNVIRQYTEAGIRINNIDNLGQLSTLNATVIGNTTSEPVLASAFAGLYVIGGADPATDLNQVTNIRVGSAAVAAEKNNFNDGSAVTTDAYIEETTGTVNLSRAGSGAPDGDGVIVSNNNVDPAGVYVNPAITLVNTTPALPPAINEACAPAARGEADEQGSDVREIGADPGKLSNEELQERIRRAFNNRQTNEKVLGRFKYELQKQGDDQPADTPEPQQIGSIGGGADLVAASIGGSIEDAAEITETASWWNALTRTAHSVATLISPTVHAEEAPAIAAPFSGETVSVGPIATLPAGKSVIITFSVTVDPLDPAEIRTRIVNQGSASWTGAGSPGSINTTDPTPNVDSACTALPSIGTGTCTPVDRPDTQVTSVTRVGTTPTNAASVQWTVTFAAPLSGLTASNLTLNESAGTCTGESITSVTGVGGGPAFTQYTVTAGTGTGDCTLRVDVANDGGISHDLTNEPFTGGDTIAIDKTVPTVLSINRASANPTNAASVDYTVTFSEAVTGVDPTDFLPTTSGVAGVSATTVAGGPTVYTVSVNTGTGDGSFRIDLSDNDSIVDAAGNPLGGTGNNNGSLQGQTYNVDKTAPTVDIVDVTPDPRSTAVSSITINFSENVAGFDIGDLTLTRNGGPNLLTGAQTITGGPMGYTLNNLSGITGTDGTYVLTVTAPGGISDAATNVLAAGATDQWVMDTAKPNVTINQAAGQADPAFLQPINFTVVFNEPVTDFDDASDISTAGSTAAGVLTAVITQVAPNDGTTYNVAISGATSDGTVVATVTNGAAVDAAGNTSNASTSTDNSVAFVTCVAPPSGMKAWYTGDGTARDIAGGNDGTLVSGAAYGAGKVGQAFQLNGTGAHVSVQAVAALQPASVTADAWFRLDSLPGSGTGPHIISKPVGPATLNSYVIWLRDGRIHARVGNGTTNLADMDSGVTAAVGTWYHVALTFDDATDTAGLYVNGAQTATGIFNGSLGYDGHPLLIGAESNNETLQFFFPGQIDEVEIFDRALAAGEVQSLYAADSGGKCKPSDLSVTKTDGGVTTTPGQTITYTFNYANAGEAATGVTLTENVPANTTFTSAGSTAGWSCADGAPAGTACTLNVGSLASLGTGTATFVVTVVGTLPAGVTDIGNAVFIADDGANGTELDTNDNVATDFTPVTAQPDLSLTKSDGGSSAIPGQTIIYSLGITNSGNQDAAGVVLTETVPANTTFNAASSSAGWSCANNSPAGTTCTLAVGNLGGGGFATPRAFAVTVNSTVPAGVDQISNNASVADNGANGADPTNNNSANDTTPLTAQPDFTITKTDGNTSTIPGGTVTYTLNYSNVGTQGATGVVLTETVPANTTFNAGASTGGWNCAPNGNAGSTCTLAVGGLAAGVSGSATFAVTVDTTGLSGVNQISNTATVGDDGANGVDPTLPNASTDTTPRNCQPVAVNNPANASGLIGTPFSETFTQSGGFGTLTYSTASALPNGVTLSSAGVLSGTPTQTGNFPIVVTVTDGNGCTGTSATYNLNITCNNNPVVQNNSDSGVGSLRHAVATACSGSTITFAPSVTGSIPVNAGPIVITRDMTIDGPGAGVLSLTGDGDSGVIEVDDPSVVTIDDLTITGGYDNSGGAGVRNGGRLALNRVVVTANDGYGIFNFGDLTVTSSTISNQTRLAGIGTSPTGGITVTVIDSTISGNSLGGIFMAAGELNLIQSTVSGNTVPAGSTNLGGALTLYGSGNIIASTITNNTVSNDPTNAAGVFAGSIAVPANVTVRSSIIAGNTSNNVIPDVRTFGSGAFTSQGYNLIGNVGPVAAFSQPTDQTGTGASTLDPRLAPLANNGGLTATHALCVAASVPNASCTGVSPAIDRGINDGRPEVQQVVVTGASGNFTLTFNGQTTASLAFNASAASVQSALNSLSSIGGVGGTATVTKRGDEFTITFGGSLNEQNLPQMTATGSGGATAVVSTIVNGAAIGFDQRGSGPNFVRPYDLPDPQFPDAAGGDGSDIGAYELNNTPPTIAAVATTRQQGTPVSNSTIANVTDIESGNGSVVVTVNGGPSATVNGVTVSNIANNNGVITASVVASCTATNATFTLTATDTGGLTATSPLTVTVNANAAPTLTYNASYNIFNTANGSIAPTALSDNGSVAGTVLVSQGGYAGGISVHPTTGVVTLTGAAPIGAHAITVRATDNCGAVTNATFTLNVLNNPPAINPAAAATRQRGSAGTVSTVATVSDLDQPAGTLAVAATSVPAGITVTNVANANGTVTANIAADCNAALGANTVVFTVSDSNGGSTSANYTVNVTANTAPTLTYANATVPVGGSLTINPATGPADNGSIASIVLQSQGAYNGGISVNNATGVVTLTGAVPLGTHTIVVRATDNCGTTTDASFTLTVGKAATALTITSDNPDPSAVGQPVVVSFAVNPATNFAVPTGNVVVTVSGGAETCTGAINPATAAGSVGSSRVDLQACKLEYSIVSPK